MKATESGAERAGLRSRAADLVRLEAGSVRPNDDLLGLRKDGAVDELVLLLREENRPVCRKDVAVHEERRRVRKMVLCPHEKAVSHASEQLRFEEEDLSVDRQVLVVDEKCVSVREQVLLVEKEEGSFDCKDLSCDREARWLAATRSP